MSEDGLALHEACHAVVAHALGKRVVSVSIIPIGNFPGHTVTASSFGGICGRTRKRMRKKNACRNLAVIVAGHYGNWLVDGSERVSDQIPGVTKDKWRYDDDDLCAQSLVQMADFRIAVNLALRIGDRVIETILRAERKAGRILKRRWKIVNALADELVKHKALAGSALQAILGGIVKGNGERRTIIQTNESRSKDADGAVDHPLKHSAYHEASHAIVARFYKKKVEEITVVKDGNRAGATLVDFPNCWEDLPIPEDGMGMSPIEAGHADRLRRRKLIFIVAGHVGHNISSKRLLMSASLTEKTLEKISKQEPVTFSGDGEETDTGRAFEILNNLPLIPLHELHNAETRAKRILDRNWSKIVKIAKRLMHKLTLKGKELKKLLQ